MLRTPRIVRALMRRVVTLSEAEWLLLRVPADASVEEVKALVEESLGEEPFCYAVDDICHFEGETSNELKVVLVQEYHEGGEQAVWDLDLERDESGELAVWEDEDE